jgi:hypothetical protein
VLEVIIGTFILLFVLVSVTWCTKRHNQKRLMMSKQKRRQSNPDADNALDVYLDEQVQEPEKQSFRDISGFEIENTEQIELELAENAENFTLAAKVISISASNDKVEVEQSVKQAKIKGWDIVLTLTILSQRSVPFRGEDVKAALNFADLEPGNLVHKIGDILKPTR